MKVLFAVIKPNTCIASGIENRAMWNLEVKLTSKSYCLKIITVKNALTFLVFKGKYEINCIPMTCSIVDN